MLRLTLKNLKANRVRFAMTTFAVVLAVSFVVSSFVLTDGLRSTFGDLSADIVDGTDLEVRPVEIFGETNVVDDTTLDTVLGIDIDSENRLWVLDHGNHGLRQPRIASGGYVTPIKRDQFCRMTQAKLFYCLLPGCVGHHDQLEPIIIELFDPQQTSPQCFRTTPAYNDDADRDLGHACFSSTPGA